MPNTRSMTSGDRLALAKSAAECAGAMVAPQAEIYFRDDAESDARMIAVPGRRALDAARDLRRAGRLVGSIRIDEPHGPVWYASQYLATYGRAA